MAGHPKCPACHGKGEFQDSEDGGHWVQCDCAENIYVQFAVAEKERDALKEFRDQLNLAVRDGKDGPIFDAKDIEYLRVLGSYGERMVQGAWLYRMACKAEATLQRLADAEKRAAEAEAKAAQQQAITASEIVMLLEGMAGDRRYDCLSRSKFVEIADEFKRIYPRAQAVAEVLDNAKEIYADHNANNPRDEDASDCWCGTCNAVRKLAALDVKEEKPRGR